MERLAALLTGYVIQRDAAKEGDRQIYQYAFERVLESILTLIASMIIAILLHMAVEGVLFFLFFIPLRSYAGGLHLKHFVSCFLLSCLTYSVILITVKYTETAGLVSGTALTGFLAMIWFLYPADHGNRPVDEEENLYFKKRLRFVLTIDFMAALVFLALQKTSYLYLMAEIFFLVAMTMLAGKIINRKHSGKSIQKQETEFT